MSEDKFPKDPYTILSRAAVAEALTALGYPTTQATLATFATRGSGPAFRKFGHKPLYRWGDVVDWARSKTSKPVHSTAELRVA
jgi:hypothetical protein